ncbi:3569_t:CDS:2, partial [Racocetra persica]
LYSAVNGQTLQGNGCKIVGGITFFFVACNVTLVGSLSLTTYLRICRKFIINFGRYDYKLFLVIFFISLSLTLVGIRDYGPNKFCAPADPVTPLITVALIFLILFVTSYCYVMTLLEVNIQQNNIRRLGSDVDAVKFSRIDLIVVRKIIGYILIFLIEWFPSIVYFIAQMVQYDNIWIYTAAAVAINFGGIGNMILYIAHESWSNKYDSSEPSSSIRNTSGSGTYIFDGNRISKSNQELYPQITVHNTITIEKEKLASSTSTLGLSNQKHN